MNSKLEEKVKDYYSGKDIVLVWYCKVLQNTKAIFYLPDDKLFVEAIVNGDSDEIYLDEYKKCKNIVFK